MPIYGDLYQNLQWSLTFDLKVVTHLKSASEASDDVINMATIMRNCSLIKAMVCVGMVIFIQRERFFKHNINYFSHMMVSSMLYLTLTMNYFSITIFCIFSYKYPAYRATFRLMAENVIAPPRKFRLSYLKEDFKLRLVIDVCTMFAEALVFDSLLHMLPY